MKDSRPLHEGVDWNQNITVLRVILHSVALFTRAWIEILIFFLYSNFMSVALFTRAWIEIHLQYQTLFYMLRRPLHEGVDWNTSKINILIYGDPSPSSRGRGLKYSVVPPVLLLNWSPSSRGRGLKYSLPKVANTHQDVALFTRAWIEMYSTAS